MNYSAVVVAHWPDLAAVVLIMAFAFSVRYVNLMDGGIMWDEPFYVVGGIHYIDYLTHLDFSAVSWGFNMEHPPVSKYIYGIAICLFNGGSNDFNAFYISKVVSAAMGALTCALVYLVCRESVNRYVAVLAPIILALIPDFVAYTQVAAIDGPLAMFFTLTMYLFIMAVKKDNVFYYALSALSFGLTISTKFNGILALPVMLIFYLMCHKKDRRQSHGGTGILPRIDAYVPIVPTVAFIAIAAAMFYLLWPWLWIDPLNLVQSISHWVNTPSEYFLGVNQQAPLYYYPLYFLVTTPVLLLISLAIGLYYSLRSRDRFMYAMAVWFALPFSYGFYSFVQDGMRYLLMIYPAVAIICGYGIWAVASRISGTKDRLKVPLFAGIGVLVTVNLILTLASVSPYYLDYYNELSGGVQNVADHRLFGVGEWGEGLSGAVIYLEQNAPNNSIVYVAARPNFYIERFRQNNSYIVATSDDMYAPPVADYIITNRFAETYYTLHFNKPFYNVAYQTKVQGVPLVTVYGKIA